MEPGCRGGGRCYSVAVVEDGRLVAKYENVPLHRLIRLIWELRPQVLALDNVQELARTRRELGRVFSMLPPELSIVQPTRLPDGSLIDIRRLARLAGLDPGGGKLSPSRTAYLAALLAEMGYGSTIKLVEEKTRIIVAKNRRLKRGGMSSPRYQRRVRAAILRAVKDIKRVLDKNGLDYDLLFRKSGGGLDSAVFIVYAPRSRLQGIIRSHSDTDVRIEIQPVYKSRIVFEEDEARLPGTRRPYIIVGVDPGISTGLAAIDLRGRPVLALSRRGIDREEVVELIRRHGVPVMIATDVNPAPEFARKLAGMLRVPLYAPPVSLSVEEKRSIFETYAQRYPELRRVSDSHVRDAFAAAVKAYRAYESKLRQIESHLARMNLDIDVEKIKAAVIRGHSIAEAIEQAINDALNGVGLEEYVVASRREQKREQPAEKPRAEDRAAELELLRAENLALRRRLRMLEEQLRDLELERRLLLLEVRAEVERDREVAALQERLSALRTELEKLREENKRLFNSLETLKAMLYAVARGEALPAPRLHDVNGRTIEELEERLGGSRLIAVLESVNPVQVRMHAKELRRLLLAAAVPRENLEEARKSLEKQLMVPVLALEDYLVAETVDTVLLDPGIVVDAYERLRLLKEEARREEERRRRTLTMDKLRALLEEYRARRARRLLEAAKNEPCGAGGG